MLYRHVLLAMMAIALFGSIAKADAPKEIKTGEGQAGRPRERFKPCRQLWF
jgi:hypothetical protein